MFVFLSRFLSFVYRLGRPIVVRNLSRLVCILIVPFCGYDLAPWLSGREELDVRQLGVGMSLWGNSYVRVSRRFHSVRSTPFWRC